MEIASLHLPIRTWKVSLTLMGVLLVLPKRDRFGNETMHENRVSCQQEKHENRVKVRGRSGSNRAAFCLHQMGD